jgi:AcrR family transcriptional regulator
LLLDLRDAPGEPAARYARRFQFAALEGAGRWGYGGLTVQGILDLAGLGRTRFYRLFDSKEDCFASAYELVAGALVHGLLAGARAAAGWEAGLRTALEALAVLLEEEPMLMKGLVAEAHAVAGVRGPRTEVLERLSRAVDTARREIKSRHSPPLSSSQFILRMIEFTMSRALTTEEPERFRTALPDLLWIAGAIYLHQPPPPSSPLR